jgi:hypothetical protein
MLEMISAVISILLAFLCVSFGVKINTDKQKIEELSDSLDFLSRDFNRLLICMGTTRDEVRAFNTTKIYKTLYDHSDIYNQFVLLEKYLDIEKISVAPDMYYRKRINKPIDKKDK